MATSLVCADRIARLPAAQLGRQSSRATVFGCHSLVNHPGAPHRMSRPERWRGGRCDVPASI
jgi:hypothetical protein